MTEDNFNTDSTSPLPFEEYVRQTLAMLVVQQNELRQEMAQRFIQLSRQIRDLDQKVDVYAREHGYLKDDIRELRAKANLQ